MPRIEDYDYPLPPELVAQYPLPQRDASRLLVLGRDGGTLHHAIFRDLGDWLDAGDLLVINDSRVFPARLRGTKTSGGQVELLLHHLPEPEGNGVGVRDFEGGGQGSETHLQSSLKLPPATPYRGVGGEFEGRAGELRSPGPPLKTARARATFRARRGLKAGQLLHFGSTLEAEVISVMQPGVAEVRFYSPLKDTCQAVLEAGEVPLPPYIRRSPDSRDRERYQTVFAQAVGAIACPTAGLHFTDAVLGGLARRGIEVASLTLHVGPGTFMPVRGGDYTGHRLQPEYFILPAATAARLNRARAQGKRLVAVGTTTVRVLEYCAGAEGFQARSGWCDLFIYPGYQFKAVDRLLTNFHLPKSTLLLLVSAFAGRDLIMLAYREAVKEKYRFYSYGDCMLIM